MSSGMFAIPIAVLLLVITSLWWVERERRLAASHLAEALIGEISAVLESIETQRLIDLLEKTKDDRSTIDALHSFALPRFIAFEANAARLDRLPGSIERTVINLFDRWSALKAEVNGAIGPAGDPKRVLGEINESLKLADEVLLALRPIANSRSQAHHL